MTINVTCPTGQSGMVIGATRTVNGVPDVQPTLTRVTVNGVSTPVCAVLEVQGGPLLLPRMTAAEIAALPQAGSALTAGMQVFNSTTNSLVTYTAAAGANGVAGFTSGSVTVSGVLTAANITGMNAAPVLIIPAPAAGFAVLVNWFELNFVRVASFAAGGAISLEYGNAAAAAGPLATGTIAAGALTAANNTISKTVGASLSAVNTAAVSGIALYISNDTAAFTGGVGSTVNYTVNYVIVPVT